MIEKQTCDLCKNHCPIDSLGCGRGEYAYGSGAEGGRGRDADGEALGGLAAKLADTGRVVSIKASHIRRAGKDPNVMFDVLGEDDREALEALLDKLKSGWDKMHAERRGARCP